MLDSHKIYFGQQLKKEVFKLKGILFFNLLKNHSLSVRTFHNWRKIKVLQSNFTIEHDFLKAIKHEGKLYFNCNIPGLPFPNFHNKLLSIGDSTNPQGLEHLGIVQIGFTKKCPLNCEHCYEGKILNQPESLSLAEHQLIVSKLQESGVPMIQFGGGEPLNRYDDLIVVLKGAKKVSDFWIYTSGFGLTLEKAKSLKKAGLSGVSISLDHYNETKHNEFRRNQKSYAKAIDAIKFAQEAGLLTALTICVTRDFCSVDNLEKYHQLAFKLGVPFIQLMEPRATGNYEGKNVMLEPEHFRVLEKFYISRNSDVKYSHLPIVQYTGYQQRQKGCAGAGNKYIYIDTEGFIHSCPFCRNKKSHFLYGDINKDLVELKKEGCDLIHSSKNQEL
jgi:MoaA/NifB/PqqE/SkfB family radical SAM enzyme